MQNIKIWTCNHYRLVYRCAPKNKKSHGFLQKIKHIGINWFQRLSKDMIRKNSSGRFKDSAGTTPKEDADTIYR